MALINEFLNDAKLSNRSYDARIEEIATSLDIGLHGAGVLVSDILELVNHGSSREKPSGSQEMSMRLHALLIFLGELGKLVDHLEGVAREPRDAAAA